MRKLFIATAVIGSLISSLANAKTEGNYVGIDLIQTETSADKTIDGTGSSSNDAAFKIKDADQISLGVNYKYAFNFNNFFVSPGIFFDYSDISAKDSANDEWNLDYRLGAKVDLGYDVTDKFAVFVNAGIVNNYYTVDWKSSSSVSKKSDSDLSLAYGLGVKYSVLDNLDASLGYEMSSFDMDSPDYPTMVGKERTEIDVQTIRVGASYKF